MSLQGIARLCLSSAVIALTTVPTVAQEASAPVVEAERLASALVVKMTTDEKVEQLLNVAPAIPRLGIPAYNWWTESLHGAGGAVPTTNFPQSIGLAATFDPPLIHDVARVISTELQGLHTLARQTGHLGKIGTGLDTWAPNINIFRDPRWGRGQETYGEDPFLTAQLGVAYVKGIQGPNPDLPDVIASPKHFAVHSGPEPTRHTDNIMVTRHDLEDTYLPAFRAAIVEGKAGSIMCAYNRVDGQPACASDLLLKDHLRGAWGFKGYVVSDCDAVFDIYERHKFAPDAASGVAVGLLAGVDNECHTGTIGEAKGLADRYKAALKAGYLTEGDVDRVLVRLFSARYRNGDLGGMRARQPNAMPVSAVGTKAGWDLSLTSAEKSLVLLKNNGLLPLKPNARIAVIGPLGDATRVLRGNYSSPNSAPPISVAEGLRRAMPQAQVTYVPFAPSITDGDLVTDGNFLTPDGKPGLRALYYNAVDPDQPRGERKFGAKPVVTRIETNLSNNAMQLKEVHPAHKVVWDGFFVAPESGLYKMGVTAVKGAIEIDGKPVITSDHYSLWGEPPKYVEVELTKGERYPLHFDIEGGGAAGPGLFWKRISRDPWGDMARAAADADVLVAVVGLTADLEGEEMPLKIEGFDGGDKTNLELPMDHRELLIRAKALGKPLVVVTMNGSPINMSWPKDNADALLEAWYPGQAGGLAVANVLSGKTNPSGRLPLTFYKDTSDLPPFTDYAMKGRTYRYYTGKPVYGFGYGLSYTTFGYGAAKVEPVGGSTANGIRVTTQVTNTGTREGEEVVQAYLRFPDQPGAPRVALRGIQRVSLKPGETKAVTLELSPRDLSAVRPDGVRQVFAGTYRLSLGGGQPESGLPVTETTFSVDRVVDLPK
ncbi:MAG: glycoside hydrolase family 3 [Novosphingobium sp. 16-62-11]|uniref:glycoside hydrolase family 3 C-terminal domain-containing protein n=1 Tax=Novosphingobium sp. 17-62-19 TaxID=1970406 RepID=UPI000BDAC4BE|nr:glycoside hydrolase family 3 C-terminal domain-containing protein [Novosphingobium sp. 17-62-19]OYX94826.1 MAG: glycoside hydrolase family 3 [Novosphingobium sp. 35-62-5]OYZ45324.1 MAG: glycoside hydrolase family 3 [Novosphingobium sp. 16-62-11]OZA21613.1 MAG: glycoside hydrolase family 3 [Novosphingobium sp. 17-62-19]HQS95877.1 glycoside hydrolase family 3 C-terminal domain-containing protein [Novosphingobium sp.]